MGPTPATETRPERELVRRSLVAAAAALPAAAVIGYASAGGSGALSAALGIVVVALNFAAHGLSLAWAAGVSVTAVHAVALGGFVVRMGAIVAILFTLARMPFFSPVIFGLSAVAATVALLVYESRLVAGGLGSALQIPPDRAAAVAAERLRRREEVF